MGIYKSKKDGAWWIDYRHKGRRYRKKVGSSKRQAEIVLGKVKSQIAENKFLDVTKNQQITLPEFLKFYLSEYSYINNKPSTHYRNTKIAENLKRHFGNIHLYNITDIDIDNGDKSSKGCHTNKCKGTPLYIDQPNGIWFFFFDKRKD